MLFRTTCPMSMIRVLLVVLLAHVAASKEALWIEGEDYANSTFNRHNWYQNTNITKDILSPGQPGASDGTWHAHFDGTEAVATYRFEIEEGGTYNWWIRLNPFKNNSGGGNYSYRYKAVRGTWTETAISTCFRRRSTTIRSPGTRTRATCR